MVLIRASHLPPRTWRGKFRRRFVIRSASAPKDCSSNLTGMLLQQQHIELETSMLVLNWKSSENQWQHPALHRTISVQLY